MSAIYKPVTLNCSCWRHIINILLTELSRSVWENLDLGRLYRPHCVRSVLMTLVKILPYRPPARLIRAKYKECKSLKTIFFFVYLKRIICPNLQGSNKYPSYSIQIILEYNVHHQYVVPGKSIEIDLNITSTDRHL